MGETQALTDKPILRETVREEEANEQVRVKVDATGGTFTLTYGAQTTSAQAYDVAAEDLEADLEALSSIPNGAVSVSGGPGDSGGTTPYIVDFTGDLAGTDVGAITANSGSLTGGAHTVTITVLTAGSDGRIVAQHLSDVVTDPESGDAVQVPNAADYPSANATELDPTGRRSDPTPTDIIEDLS